MSLTGERIHYRYMKGPFVIHNLEQQKIYQYSCIGGLRKIQLTTKHATLFTNREETNNKYGKHHFNKFV